MPDTLKLEAETIFARIVSILFHPLLMASYMFTLFAFLFPLAFDPIREESTWDFIFIIFCVTFLLPVLNVGLFRAFGTIQTVAMEDRRERILPFTFVALLHLVATYLFFTRTEVTLNDNFLKFLFIIDALVCISVLITFFYKISVHTVGIWGLIGILLPLNRVADTNDLFYPTLIAIIVAGIVMSARLKLNVHTPREVMVGAMVGLATSMVSMEILF